MNEEEEREGKKREPKSKIGLGLGVLCLLAWFGMQVVFPIACDPLCKHQLALTIAAQINAFIAFMAKLAAFF